MAPAVQIHWLRLSLKVARRLVMCLAVVCFSGRVLGDGAFPDELSVYLPANAPHRIMLGTNFGLVISEDDGQNWRYVCELYITNTGLDQVNFYKLAPDGAVFAISFFHMWRSADGGCSWTQAGGSVAPLALTDAFIDPTDATFVVAIASGPAGTGIYPSYNSGITFDAALYTTTDRLTSIEISRSNPNVIYAVRVHAASSSGPGIAYLLRSSDRGATWTSQQLSTTVAPSGTEPRIMAVDPEDANTVYLRLLTLSTSQDAIGISTDGGATFAVPLTLSNAFFTSFLRASDRTLYAGTAGPDLYIRAPGATDFTRRTGPRTRCLGQRAGTNRIFGCGDSFLDGYNLGYSDDGAQTFQPILRFIQIAGPLTCPAVRDFCASQYELLLQTLGQGAPDAGGLPDAGSKPPSGGSHCSSASDAGTSVGAACAVGLLLLALSGLRRRR